MQYSTKSNKLTYGFRTCTCIHVSPSYSKYCHTILYVVCTS